MLYVDYLFRSPVKYQILHKLEELTEEIFVSQVCLNWKAWYVIAFIYNTYRLWMSVRTDQRKEMYDLHQSSDEGVEPKNSNSLEATLRELKEETGLKI